MHPSRRLFATTAAALLFSAWPGALPWAATAFPSRTVTIVLTTPAGGPSDTAARLVAKSLSAAWGQPVIIENKPGANGAIAAQAVMSAPPDGHTLLWAQAALAGLPLVQKRAPYRSLTEFTPVSNVLNFGFALFVNRDLPAQNFADFVAYARAQPGRLSYGTGTLTEYMVAEHVLKSVGVKALRVPYKGGVQLMPDLISGQVQANFGPILSGLQHVKAAKLKMLATAQPQRSALLPDVPTLAELGIPAATLPTWNALFAPAGTSGEVAEQLSRSVAQALRDPAVRGPLEASAAEPVGSTPLQLAEAVEQAIGAWKNFVREHDLQPE